MELSKAIKKREELKKKAEDIQKWFNSQQWGENKVPWREVHKAIDTVLDDIYEEYHKLDKKIEEAIQDIQL